MPIKFLKHGLNQNLKKKNVGLILLYRESIYFKENPYIHLYWKKWSTNHYYLLKTNLTCSTGTLTRIAAITSCYSNLCATKLVIWQAILGMRIRSWRNNLVAQWLVRPTVIWGQVESHLNFLYLNNKY